MRPAKTSLRTRCASPRGGIPLGRRRASANARAARCDVRPSCGGRAGPWRGCSRAALSAPRPRQAAGYRACSWGITGGQRRGPSATLGASRLSTPTAVPAGHAWAGPGAARGGLVCHPPRSQRARGQRQSMAVRRPGAPSGGLVPGGRRPRLRRARRPARPLSSLALGAGARRRHPWRPSTPSPQPPQPPGFLPQRRTGASTVSMYTDARASPRSSRGRQAASAGARRAGLSLRARCAMTHGPRACARAAARSRWARPPASLATRRGASPSRGRPRAPHTCAREGARSPRPWGPCSRRTPAAGLPVPAASPWRDPPVAAWRASRSRPRGSAGAGSQAAWRPRSVASRTTALTHAWPSWPARGPGNHGAMAWACRARGAIFCDRREVPAVGGSALSSHADSTREGPLVPPDFYRDYRT